MRRTPPQRCTAASTFGHGRSGMPGIMASAVQRPSSRSDFRRQSKPASSTSGSSSKTVLKKELIKSRIKNREEGYPSCRIIHAFCPSSVPVYLCASHDDWRTSMLLPVPGCITKTNFASAAGLTVPLLLLTPTTQADPQETKKKNSFSGVSVGSTPRHGLQGGREGGGGRVVEGEEEERGQ